MEEQMVDVEELVTEIIDCIYEVRKHLVHGYKEEIYKRALTEEFRLRGISFCREYPISVQYKDVCIGNYFADILVEGLIIVEAKAVLSLNVAHEIQLVNYLTATGINDGILVNFGGDKIEIKRKYRLLPSQYTRR